MRILGTLVALSLALLATMDGARADLPSLVDVRADSIGFYPFNDGSALLAADGHVTVHAGRRTITADSARYDLAKNVLLATGNVHVSGRGDQLDAAAYTLDLAKDSATPGMPPAGTFDAPDVSATRPYIRSRHAMLNPNAHLRMTPAEFPSSSGATFVLPTFLYTLARAQSFAQTSLPGAAMDQEIGLFGNGTSLTAAHFRYEGPQQGMTVAVDQHLFTSSNAYVVASVEPFSDHRFDLTAFDQITPRLQQQFNADHVYGEFCGNALHYQLQWSEKLGRATFVFNEFNSSQASDLTLSTYDHTLPHLITYHTYVDYGYDHNIGALPFTDAYRLTEGAHVSTPDVRLPLGITAGAWYDYALTTYDYARELTNGTLQVTVSRSMLRPRLNVVASAAFSQNGNRYRNDAPLYLGLPSQNLPYRAPDGTLWPGYFAYAGLTTLRTYSLATTYQFRGDDQFALALVRADDFPQYHGYGRPPLTATAAVSKRLNPHLKVNLGRSYSFGWNQQYLAPQWTFSLSQ